VVHLFHERGCRLPGLVTDPQTGFHAWGRASTGWPCVSARWLAPTGGLSETTEDVSEIMNRARAMEPGSSSTAAAPASSGT
jgi:hypothetical protein